MKGCEVVLLVLVILVVAIFVAALGYFWISPSPSPGPPAIRAGTGTGTLGKYSFASPQALADFNATVVKWLRGQGFAPYSEATYAQIVGAKEWDMPGLLFVKTVDPTGHMFVFVPDCYQPEETVQVVGFHTDLGGPSDAVAALRKDFGSIRKRFCELFPSASRPRPAKDAPADAPQGEDAAGDP